MRCLRRTDACPRQREERRAVLICDRARRFNGCTVRTSWRYDEFENNFFTFVIEADLPTAFAKLTPNLEIQALGNEVAEFEGRYLETRRKRDRIFDLIVGDEATDFLRQELRRADAQVAKLENRLADKKMALEQARVEQHSFDVGGIDVPALISRIQHGADTDATRVRAAIAERLRTIIRVIKVFPAGDVISKDQWELRVKISGPARAKGYFDQMEFSKKSRFFSVYFRRGVVRHVNPLTVWNAPNGVEPDYEYFGMPSAV